MITGTAWYRSSSYIKANDTHLNDRQQYSLYGDTYGSNGGLGAVQNFNQSYSGLPYDNLWYGESVQLTFDSAVYITAASFFNGSHTTNFTNGTEVWIRVDNGD